MIKADVLSCYSFLNSRSTPSLIAGILLSALMTNISVAQTGNDPAKTAKSNLRLSIGALHVRMIDQGYTESRLLFRGTATAFGLAYGRESEKSIFNFSLAGSIGKVTSKNGSLPSDYILLHPSVEYLRTIKVGGRLGQRNMFLGGVRLASFNQAMQNEQVIDNISIFSLHGLYLDFCDQITINEKQYLRLSYVLPLAVFENRMLWNSGASKYTYHDEENMARLLTSNGKFSYMNLSGNLQLAADYVIKTGKRTELKFAYKFYLARSFIEAPLHFYINELSTELKIEL